MLGLWVRVRVVALLWLGLGLGIRLRLMHDQAHGYAQGVDRSRLTQVDVHTRAVPRPFPHSDLP